MLTEIFMAINLFGFVVSQQPHIIFIFIDNMGWNDVGYHGSEIMVRTDWIIMSMSYRNQFKIL